MKKKIFSFCLVLVVLLAFFACDSNPPASNGSDVKDQTVKDVKSVSNDLKKSGATSFLNLENEEDFADFFDIFSDDTVLMDLIKNFGSEQLESDEIVQEIMGFIEKLSNTPEETSSINANLNIKNKKLLDLIYIYTLKSSVKANINTTDGKKPNDSQSNVKSTSMSASLESDIELITDTFKDTFIKDLKLRANASGSFAATDYKKIENNFEPGDEFDFEFGDEFDFEFGDEFDFEFGDEFDTSPELYEPTSFKFSYALDLSAGVSVCDEAGKGGILVLKINMNKPVTTIKLEDFEGLDDPSEMIEKILPSTFVLNLSVLDDSGEVQSEKNITIEDIMEMISNNNNNGYGGYDYN